MTKPNIGITKPLDKDNFAYSCIWLSVLIAGGHPIKIEPVEGYTEHDLQGVILGGGTDVFPGRFDLPPKEEYEYDQARDEMEIFWAERAKEEGIPCLGICRGAQLMNVFYGGSLHMDISTAYEDANYPDGLYHNAFFRKNMTLQEGTLLHRILGIKNVKVNSLHKQSIDRLGEYLTVNSLEKNGIIQAISDESHPFFLGVQFHPEFLIYQKTFRKIFNGLIKASNKRLD